MNNMEEVIKFSENHQKQEITVVEPTDEITTKLFQFLHKSDVRMILCISSVLYMFLSVRV